MEAKTLQPQSLWTRDKLPSPTHPPTHPPQISEFGLGLGGAQKCFILSNQTTGDLKSHHLQALATLTAMPAPPPPPRPPFLSAELWVICYHLGIIMH